MVYFLAKRKQAQRGAAGRVNHDGTTGGQRRGDFPSRHQEGEVPRNNLADHADRLAQYDRQIFLIKLGSATLFTANHTGEIAEMIGSQRNIGGASFTDGFAVIQRFLQSKQFGIFIDYIGDFIQNSRSLGSSSFFPGFKCFLRRGYRRIHIGITRLGKFSQGFTVGRIVRHQRFTATGPLTVNQQTVYFVKHIQILSHLIAPYLRYGHAEKTGCYFTCRETLYFKHRWFKPVFQGILNGIYVYSII